MGATRRYRRRIRRTAVLVQPVIPDDAPPATKNALALRVAANVAGRCPSCAASFETVWLAPKIAQSVMRHEPSCAALTDPPGWTEAVSAELARLAGEEHDDDHA